MWSMDQVFLLANTSETFFFSRMSSRSGDERSGRKGTKIGRGPLEVVLAGEGAFRGRGAWIAFAFDSGAAVASRSGVGMCRGNWEGATGLGSRPELLVKGWVARGSNDANAVLVDIAVACGGRRGRCNGRGWFERLGGRSRRRVTSYVGTAVGRMEKRKRQGSRLYRRTERRWPMCSHGRLLITCVCRPLTTMPSSSLP